MTWRQDLKDETDPGNVFADLRWLTEFTITEDHLKLLDRAYTSWDWCEFGAPEMDPKRPYGNSDVPGDIAEILGLPEADEETGEFPDEQLKAMVRIHAEMGLVLAIGFRTRAFIAGRYVRSAKYAPDWRLA